MEIFAWLQGKKTYIVAFIGATLGLIQGIWPEVVIPEYVWAILGSLGLTTLRMGVGTAKPPVP